MDDGGGDPAPSSGSPPQIKSQADGLVVIEHSLDALLANFRQRIRVTSLAVSDRSPSLSLSFHLVYPNQEISPSSLGNHVFPGLGIWPSEPTREASTSMTDLI